LIREGGHKFIVERKKRKPRPQNFGREKGIKGTGFATRGGVILLKVS